MNNWVKVGDKKFIASEINTKTKKCLIFTKRYGGYWQATEIKYSDYENNIDEG